MIHTPKRSVTRFFVPLIDVLLLLFCIFLLMPIADEKNLEDTRDKAADLGDELTSSRSQLDYVNDQLSEFAELRPRLQELSKVLKENEHLKALLRKNLQERAAFKVIDIDGKTGKISYYDPKGTIEIGNEKAAKELIERQKKEAGEKRELYYYFLYPRPLSDEFPTGEQETNYKKWFADVANSLKET